MMLGQQSHQGGASISVLAHGATVLKDVESFGKQDPYLRVTVDFNNAKSFQKTFVHKNAGKKPIWNQTLEVPLNGEPDLFVEIMDDETTADAVIAFAAIPISQVVHSTTGSVHGLFDVFTADGKPNGEVHLTLTARNVPGQGHAGGYGSSGSMSPIRGKSYIVDAHQKRMKSLKNKEKAADAGAAVAGGLLALGAGLLANKYSADQKKEERERKEAEAQQELDREKFERERKRLEDERTTFEKTRTDWTSEHSNDNNNSSYRHETSISTSHSHSHTHEGGHHGGSGHHGANEWDPVGNYSAGMRVRYHGRDYICLQGHQSNPTWEPTQAHSLWRSD